MIAYISCSASDTEWYTLRSVFLLRTPIGVALFATVCSADGGSLTEDLPKTIENIVFPFVNLFGSKHRLRECFYERLDT